MGWSGCMWYVCLHRLFRRAVISFKFFSFSCILRSVLPMNTEQVADALDITDIKCTTLKDCHHVDLFSDTTKVRAIVRLLILRLLFVQLSRSKRKDCHHVDLFSDTRKVRAISASPHFALTRKVRAISACPHFALAIRANYLLETRRRFFETAVLSVSRFLSVGSPLVLHFYYIRTLFDTLYLRSEYPVQVEICASQN